MSSSRPDPATSSPPELTALRTVALAGNPNCGKTTVFNALTGLRQKVGNYPGVTVEKKEGRLRVEQVDLTLVDIPGTYSLSARSLDEQVARDVLLGLMEGTTRPDLIVSIVDASNLERNLYLTTQLMELGRPVVVALNMMDVAAQNGIDLDAQLLAEHLGVPVIPLVASRNIGFEQLRQTLIGALPPLPKRQWTLPREVEHEVQKLAGLLVQQGLQSEAAEGEAIRLLLNDTETSPVKQELTPEVESQITESRAYLESLDIDWWSVEAEGRYGWIKNVAVAAGVVHQKFRRTTSDKIDSVLTHRVLGPVIFAVVMAVVFQSIFKWAELPMNYIDQLTGQASNWVRTLIPDGDLQGLVAEGVIPGVGGVVKFLPQILILMFFISLLEDTGYMARAAFIMDRIMRRVGLNGKSFIPLLSSFACAIPGIMATRTIENSKDRLVTILIAPLMSCSARLPVYTLMIGAFFPAEQTLFGVITLAGLVLFAMYLLGIVAAISMGWLFKNTLIKSGTTPLIMELPPYRLPSWRNIFSSLLSRTGQFLHRAGTVILAISMILWFLAAYPKNLVLSKNYITERQQVETLFTAQKISLQEKETRLAQLSFEETSERSRMSYLGRIGHLIEPVIAPLGFNWKIGVGLVSAFAAREVLVSTLAIVYSVGDDSDEGASSLHQALRNDRYPDGRPVYSPLVAVSLMVFFVLALQCMSTFAIVRRETNSWRWPFFMLGYMTLLAYLGSLTVFQGGRLLGFQ